MPTLLLTVAGGLLLFNLLVHAFFLWLSCRLCRVARPVTALPGAGQAQPVGYRRALAVTALFGLCCLLLVGAGLSSGDRFSPTGAWLLAGALLLSSLALLLAFLRALVGATLVEAFRVGLFW